MQQLQGQSSRHSPCCKPTACEHEIAARSLVRFNAEKFNSAFGEPERVLIENAERQVRGGCMSTEPVSQRSTKAEISKYKVFLVELQANLTDAQKLLEKHQRSFDVYDSLRRDIEDLRKVKLLHVTRNVH